MLPELISSEPLSKTEAELPSYALNFLRSKKERILSISNDPSVRKRIADYLFTEALRVSPNKADFAMVFGTSWRTYPDKFAKRVHWASMLWHTGRVKMIIFTGKSDDETGDESQCEDARDLAVTQFRIPPSSILLAGGNNTQANAREALHWVSEGNLIFAVSENHHLIRGLAVAQEEARKKQAKVIAHPVGGISRLNPNHPSIIAELMKAEAYNHTKYKVNSNLTQGQRLFISETIGDLVKYIEQILRQQPRPKDNMSDTYGEWLNKLPEEYKLQGIINAEKILELIKRNEEENK